jgi:hypothetical protein
MEQPVSVLQGLAGCGCGCVDTEDAIRGCKGMKSKQG